MSVKSASSNISMSAETLADLLLQQEEAMYLVERALSNFKKLGKANQTHGAVRSRLSRLKENFQRCQNLHDQLLASATDAERSTEKYFKERRFAACEETFNVASDYITDCLLQFEPTASQSVADVSQHHYGLSRNSLELPRINLPQFSGSLSEWESFRDRFTALIRNNRDLSDVTRLHYLNSCLHGEANEILRHLTITAANFKVAWKLLESRYENKCTLINGHLHALFNIPIVTSENASDLQALRDKVNTSIQALTNLGRKVDAWDEILVYLVIHKLDKGTRKAWEFKQADNLEYPTFKELDQFLNSRIRALQSCYSEPKLERKSTDFNNSKSSRFRLLTAHASTPTAIRCPMCQHNHFLSKCPKLLETPAPQRLEFIKRSHRCINCFSSKHKVGECTNKYTCRICHKKHHTLLHLDQPLLPLTSDPPQSNLSQLTDNAPVSINALSQPILPTASVLLTTAWIEVSSSSGRVVKARALLDSGSMATIITENLSHRLRLVRKPMSIPLSLIDKTKTCAKSAAQIYVSPCNQTEPKYNTTALILPSLSEYTPVRITRNLTWPHIQNLNWADPDPMSSDPIDIIIGADLFGAVLREGLRHGAPHEPTAQNTIFGWILSGPTSQSSSFPPSMQILHTSLSSDISSELRRFWEIEELPSHTYLTPDEKKCEDHFLATHTRTSRGTYVVRLPFKREPPIAIGNSKFAAQAMFLRQEQRFISQPDLQSEYSDFLTEYERLGHMTKVSESEQTPSHAVYIPHHAVIRDSSSTTHLRVVFNASARTSNGTSLNDHLLIGPKLQTDLPSVLLQWRQYRYVYTADIAKMYRQILIDPRDVDYQRILWRKSPTDPISEYRLRTVTYGTAPAPFLALRVLQQLVRDEGKQFPLAIPVLRRQIYIDDCLFGADELELTRQTRDQLIALLKNGGFTPRKWASNSLSLLRDIDPSDHGLAGDKLLQEDDNLKILGITWNPTRDVFQVQINMFEKNVTTKRDVLSMIAKIFDPLGWVTPVVITAKIIMQHLWMQKCDWDEPLSPSFQRTWDEYQSQLKSLQKLSIPRWTSYASDGRPCELHGFADASTVAYAAVVYLRVTLPSGEVVVSLLTAKSKVAPVKPMSVPRLELSAALLLTRTMNFVRSALELNEIPCYCWTDSTITLEWISQHASRWKTFVANRVNEIQTMLPNACWRHGPTWLNQPVSQWPNFVPYLASDAPLEKKPDILVHLAVSSAKWDFAEKFSSWDKLLRVTAYVNRFITKVRKRIESRKGEPSQAATETSLSPEALLPQEIQFAKTFWLRQIQSDLFATELKLLQAKENIPKKSRLAPLNPFLDDEKLIRVGGRLSKSELPYSNKHPIILAAHPLVTMLITDLHHRSLHAGPQLILCQLREECWILRARQVVRSVLYKCVVCTRAKAAMASEFMGDLPAMRVNTSTRAFVNCGLDYAGPIAVRTTSGRGHKSHKGYIALFICMATRAVYIDLVPDYTSESFLRAFSRFCAIYGVPSDVYSDNGTTFRGADRELTTAFRAATRDPTNLNRFATDKISWHFIPPSAPHFGGLWEAGIRSIKYHLKRVIGANTYTFEELSTFLHQISACLNSRPIAALSENFDDYAALTPGHFLIGAPLTSVPMPSQLNAKEERLARWQRVQQMYERFWHYWSHDYVHTLQQRAKWLTKQHLAQVGRIVLLKNPLLPPCQWELARIIECHPGDDGITRVVTIKTARSTYKRPIVKLCFLPVDINQQTECQATSIDMEPI